jgi:hypothetical protein
MKRTSILISEEFYSLCKQYNIKFSEALRVGISIILAEKGVKQYDNKLNLYRKMNYFKDQLEKLSNQINKADDINL